MKFLLYAAWHRHQEFGRNGIHCHAAMQAGQASHSNGDRRLAGFCGNSVGRFWLFDLYMSFVAILCHLTLPFPEISFHFDVHSSFLRNCSVFGLQINPPFVLFCLVHVTHLKNWHYSLNFFVSSARICFLLHLRIVYRVCSSPCQQELHSLTHISLRVVWIL